MSKRKSSVPLGSNEKMVATHLEKNNNNMMIKNDACYEYKTKSACMVITMKDDLLLSGQSSNRLAGFNF